MHVSCHNPIRSHVLHNHPPEAAHLSLTAAHRTLPSTAYPFLKCPPVLALNSGLSIPLSLPHAGPCLTTEDIPPVEAEVWRTVTSV